jgi:hypothetical protein
MTAGSGTRRDAFNLLLDPFQTDIAHIQKVALIAPALSDET